VRREITPPLSRQDLRPLEKDCKVLQFSRKLSDLELTKVAKLLENRLDVELYVYAGLRLSKDDTTERFTDLQFLRFFPFVKRLSFMVPALTSLDDLSLANSNLVSLGVCLHWGKPLSLRPIERFTQLEHFSVEGPVKDIEVVSEFRRLREFGIASVAMRDFSIIPETVENFWMKTGSAKSLSGMERLSKLRELWLAMPYGLADISAISELASLEKLWLDCLARVDKMPDCSKLANLRSAIIEMKRIKSLSGLAAAPSLETISVFRCPELSVDSFRCFAGHPTLIGANLHFGTQKQNQAAATLLGLPAI